MAATDKSAAARKYFILFFTAFLSLHKIWDRAYTSYGHSREYWTRSGNLQAEAFAHFFEASMGSEEKLEMLANFFPTAFGVFSTLIESIHPDQYVRVLERSR